jgi:hypothetical protein
MREAQVINGKISSFNKAENSKITMVLAVLVGMERRNEFLLNSTEGMEIEVMSIFGSHIKELVETCLSMAERMILEARENGQTYIETTNILNDKALDQGEFLLDNSCMAPLTYKELAFSSMLRTMAHKEPLEPREILTAY